VRAFASELRALAEQLGIPHGVAVATLMLGEIDLLCGRAEGAEILLREACELLRELGTTSGLSLALSARAEAAIARNRRDLALVHLRETLDLARASPFAAHLVIRAHGVALRAAAPEAQAAVLAAAAAELAEIGDICEPCSIGFLIAGAEIYARSGEPERARDHLEHADRIAAMWQGGPWTARIGEARAELARADRPAAGALA
jgi:tetratricopeptide (TPR) repeat protein